MENTVIRINSFDELQPFFGRTGMSMIHCAVQRSFPFNYKHHYIILAHTWFEIFNICEIIHVSPGGGNGSKGMVKKESYSKEQLENDIRNGLYVYHNSNYPQNDDDYLKAYGRFLKRQGKTDYSVSLKNCEHLVNYILTGRSVSYQLRALACPQRWLSMVIDLFTFYREETLCLCLLIGSSLVGSFYVTELKTKETIEKESKRKISGGVVSFFRFIRRIFKASDQLSRFEKSLVESVESCFKSCCDFLKINPNLVLDSTVIKTIRRKVKSKMCRLSAIITCVLVIIGKGFFAYRTINLFRNEMDAGIINQQDCELEINKVVSSCISSVFGTFVILDFFFRVVDHTRQKVLLSLIGGIIGYLSSESVGFAFFRLYDMVVRYLRQL